MWQVCLMFGDASEPVSTMLRVFVSSTSKDLLQHRAVVGDVILERRAGTP